MSVSMYKAWLRAGALSVACISLAPFLHAQGSVELANLREDVRMLSQRIGEMQLRIEQLERENHDLRSKSADVAQSYATVAQLNEAVADLNRNIKSAAANTKGETLQQVSVQLEKLATQTNAAIESLAKSTHAANRSPVAAPTFSDDYSKEGVTYTVQKGDTLALIAKKTGGNAKDIINANKLADPSKIQAGQTLFIPGGK